jgi:hypothetical protein
MLFIDTCLVPHGVIAGLAAVPGLLTDVGICGIPKLHNPNLARDNAQIRFLALRENMTAALAARKLKRNFFPQDQGAHQPNVNPIADIDFFAPKSR